MFKIVFWYWWALAAMFLVFEMTLPGLSSCSWPWAERWREDSW